MKTRKQALEWWNNLPLFVEGSKHHLSDKYFRDRGHNNLTGREIEDIYVKEYMLPRVKEALSLSFFGAKELETEEIKELFNDLYK